ncbi:hypothetical protein BH11GEM2_BH11GEM2_06930 [soil metagenome]
MKNLDANNLDSPTVAGFGEAWTRFDQSALPEVERPRICDDYPSVFPWELVDPDFSGAELRCGTGRSAVLAAPRVGVLHCVDPRSAIEIARLNCRPPDNVRSHRASVDALPFEDGSLDFAYSLGVLHHVPDTVAAIRSVARKLRIGAPIQLYLDYAFDNRRFWFRSLWRACDMVRQFVARMPFGLRFITSRVLAAVIYLPLARTALLLDRVRAMPASFPLAFYRDKSFYAMHAEALDQCGTWLEKRFTKKQIEAILRSAGMGSVRFSDRMPYSCVSSVREH